MYQKVHIVFSNNPSLTAPHFISLPLPITFQLSDPISLASTHYGILHSMTRLFTLPFPIIWFTFWKTFLISS